MKEIAEALNILEDRKERKLSFWHRGENEVKCLDTCLAALKTMEWIEKCEGRFISLDKERLKQKFLEFQKEGV